MASPAAAQAPPANDNYLLSTIIPQAQTKGWKLVTFTDQVDTTAATTQADLFDPNQQGQPQTGGGSEPLTCHGTRYGKTVWYDLHPRVPLGVELVTSGFPTAINVYPWNTTTARLGKSIGCQTSGGLSNDYALPFELQPGKAYTVQIGGLQQGSDFASGALELQASFYPDHDGDGVLDPLDACPTLKGVEAFGGCPPTLHPFVHVSWSFPGPEPEITALRVQDIPVGTRVEARCRACGLDQVTVLGRHASSVSMTRFIGHVAPPGASLEIWVSKRASGHGDYRYGAIGAYFRYPVTSSGFGTRTDRCLMPGSLKPRTVCPPGGRKPISGSADGSVSPAFAPLLNATDALPTSKW